MSREYFVAQHLKRLLQKNAAFGQEHHKNHMSSSYNQEK